MSGRWQLCSVLCVLRLATDSEHAGGGFRAWPMAAVWLCRIGSSFSQIHSQIHSAAVFCACTIGSLSGNEIGAAGASALATSLQHGNCTLKKLG